MGLVNFRKTVPYDGARLVKSRRSRVNMVRIMVKEVSHQDADTIEEKKLTQNEVTLGKQLGSDINVSGFKLLFEEREPTVRR